jgi:hypothetical protein
MDWQKIKEKYGTAVVLDMQIRKDREAAKALEKYGPSALQAGGRPEFDILDFACNEVIGFDRYGEMIQHRFAHLTLTDLDIVALGTAMREISEILAPALVYARLELLEEGGALGLNEVNRFEAPEQKQQIMLEPIRETVTFERLPPLAEVAKEARHRFEDHQSHPAYCNDQDI